MLGFVIIFLSIHVALSDGKCTNERVEQCMAPLRQYSLINSTAIVPTFSESKMEQICRSFDEVEGCLRDIRDDCHVVDQKWFEGIEHSFRYICDEHFDEYVQFRTCLATPALHVEGRQCMVGLDSSLDSRSYLTGTVKYKRQRICQYARTYLDCVFNLVSSFCGEEAARWQRGMDESMLKPVLALVQCHLGDSAVTPKIIIIIVVVVIGAVLCLICLVVGIYVMRKKRFAVRAERMRQHATSNGTTGPTEAPPTIIYHTATDAAAIRPSSYPHEPPDQYPGEVDFNPPPYMEKEDPPPSYRTDTETGAAGGVSYDELPAKDRGPPDFHAPKPPSGGDYDDIGLRHAATASATSPNDANDRKPRRSSKRSGRH